MNTLAIDIGGTKFSIAVFDHQKMVRRESRITDRDGGPRWMLSQILDIAHSWDLPLAACGIGFGGPIHFAQQRVYQSTHVGGWSDFPLRDELSNALNVPTVMDNDANVGALGEAVYGAGRGYPSLFYMTL